MKKVREHRIEIRCTDEERQAWKLKANDAGISVANLIRRLLNSAEVDVSPVKPKRQYVQADPELVSQIARIGNNLNQIARGVNQGDQDDILNRLITIERMLKGVIDAH